ncbi:MAG: histidinol dehydrogenase, partial [Longimicrobiales bacterium]
MRTEGDAALRLLARELDGIELDQLELPRTVRRRALDALDAPLRAAMERAAANIATAHRAFLPFAIEIRTEPGVTVGRRPDPLGRVGVYAPGGRAAYASSVLMGAVPARVAGVREIVLCSPPGGDGIPSTVVLAAAELADVDRVFALGGAGAIAAMAYGTATVPRVDRIVGPGNAYVAEAKLQLTGVVAIDAPAGPSELLVLADESADPKSVAREVLAQAEHDPRACCVVVCIGVANAGGVAAAIAEGLARLERRDVVIESLAANGALLVVPTIGEAVEFASRYAPEHLLLWVADPAAVLPAVRNAGTVFMGASSSVAFGDYMTGANHVLPTGGSARSYSGLSTADFVRWTSWQRVEAAAAERLAEDVGVLAEAEGLGGHAAAALAWGKRSVDSRVRENDEMQDSGNGEGGGNDGVEEGGNNDGNGGCDVVREAYRAIALYSPDRTPCALDLSDNTNLFGVPPAAAQAIRDAATPAMSRYPSAYAEDLRTTLAAYAGVDRTEIVTGCGSDDVLDSAIRAFSEPGDRIAFPDPSFAMIPIFARMNGLDPIPVPLTHGLDIDPDALLATGARIIYLCSPNNPTGTIASQAAIDRIVERAPGAVILDEAYAEFAYGGCIGRAPLSERLLVVRTMSKAFGLAGLRIGYAAGPARLVAEVEKSRGPYKVSG